MDPIPEWKSIVSVLMNYPKYHNTIKAYVDTLDSFEKIFALDLSFESIDEAMNNNTGCGLSTQGFYEMKQKIYEIGAKMPKPESGSECLC